jgi:hypothetical protein
VLAAFGPRSGLASVLVFSGLGDGGAGDALEQPAAPATDRMRQTRGKTLGMELLEDALVLATRRRERIPVVLLRRLRRRGELVRLPKETISGLGRAARRDHAGASGVLVSDRSPL